jgi:biotin carboxylase
VTASSPLTVLCIASYEKGHEFLRECKRQSCTVLLLTSESLMNVAHWPRESIDDIFYMPDVNKKWNLQHTILAVSHLARTRRIDRIVPLDDFDLETAAALREHLRIPGMGETTTRYFRDKLAMRSRAKFSGLPVPEFVRLSNDAEVHEFVRQTPSPWMLKPRSQAGAIGLKKIASEHELWKALDALADQRSYYLLERYVPGQIFHVDTIVFHRELLFCSVSRYGTPPMDVTHKGGVFTTRTLPSEAPQSRQLCELNWTVLKAFGLVWGVSHSEFIIAQNGTAFFLETSARVGGANIAELVEAATEVNLWREWAKVEIAGEDGSYTAPRPAQHAAGLLISLAKQEWANTDEFADPEIVWRMKKPWHVGMIVKSSHPARIEELLTQYSDRVQKMYTAVQPPPDRPTH